MHDDPTLPPATPRARTGRRRLFAWLALGGFASAGLAAAFAPGRDVAADANAAPFCVTAPPAALVAAGDRRDDRYEVQVPATDPSAGIPDSEAHAIHQGDVVEFRVASARPGTLAVHGLTELEPVVVGGITTVSFRAIYSGRFPLHFHSVDGLHIEVAALDVQPATKTAQR